MAAVPPPEDLEAVAARRRELVQAAARRGFYALVSLLERLSPGGARAGGAGPPAQEVVRFRHDPRLTFASGDVGEVWERGDEKGWNVTTTFLGVTGATSPIPVHIAEEIALEDEEKPLRRVFLDIFHHRLISLLYRSVARVDWGREALKTADDDWSRRTMALGGHDPWAEGATSALPRWRLLRLTPLLANRARNGRALELALEDVLGPELGGARISIEEFSGVWVGLEDRLKARLGRENSRLSQDLVLGNRIWDRAGAFKIRIGPLAPDVYDRLLPGRDLHALANDVVGLVVTEPLACELELVMADVPPMMLGTREARLGQNTWLMGRLKRQVRREVELRP